MLEHELSKQKVISQKLNNVLDSIEHLIKSAPVENVPETKNIQPLVLQQPAKKKEQNLIVSNSFTKKDAQVKPAEKVEANTPTILPPSPTVVVYEYGFNRPINISNTEKIIEVQGVLQVRYDAQKAPKDLRAKIEMKEVDEDGTKRTVAFRCVRLQVNTDNSVNCVFQEIPLPAQNEFDAQNERKLSIAVAGSLEATDIYGTLAWNEISGHPANAKIKMSLVKK